MPAFAATLWRRYTRSCKPWTHQVSYKRSECRHNKYTKQKDTNSVTVFPPFAVPGLADWRLYACMRLARACLLLNMFCWLLVSSLSFECTETYCKHRSNLLQGWLFCYILKESTEGFRVLNSLTGSLALCWKHCMGGISNQDKPASMPVLQRILSYNNKHGDITSRGFVFCV